MLTVLLSVFCLFTLSSSAHAAVQEKPYSSFVAGLDSIQSAKITAEGVALLYDGDKLVFGTVVNSKSIGMQVGTNAYDSSASIVTNVGDDEESIETKMDFVRKGDDIYIKFKYGPVKNKWIHLKVSEYEAFGEALDLEREFDLADASDPAGADKLLMKKIVALVEKHGLYVNYEEPSTKKKKGKTLTTYSLEYDRKAVVPFYTELASVLTEEEKKKSVLSANGFLSSLKSKFFVDALVEESFFRVVFDETTGLPVEYTEKIMVPAHKNKGLALEHFTYVKLDKINKKVTVKVPSKTITPSTALQLMGVED